MRTEAEIRAALARVDAEYERISARRGTQSARYGLTMTADTLRWLLGDMQYEHPYKPFLEAE